MRASREDRSTSLRRECLSKAGYWSQVAARTVGDRREQQGAPKLWVYKCTYCPRYHLTKNSPIVNTHLTPRQARLLKKGETPVGEAQVAAV
jgi:hypothetical protein